MLRLKTIVVFLLVLAGVYAVWLAAWPLVQRPYAAFYRGAANTLFNSFGAGGHAEYQPLETPSGRLDTRVVCTNWRAPGWRDDALLTSSRHSAYVPTAVLIALIVATPVAWRRRLWALLWGVFVLYGFIALREAISLLNKFSYDTPIRAVDLGPTMKATVLYVVDALSGSIFMCTFVVPALIWVVVTFRRRDAAWLFGSRPAASGEGVTAGRGASAGH